MRYCCDGVILGSFSIGQSPEKSCLGVGWTATGHAVKSMSNPGAAIPDTFKQGRIFVPLLVNVEMI